MTLEYAIGPNGAQMLVHDSYHFYKENTNSSNKTYWTCKYKKRFGCLSRIHTSDEKIVKYHKSHNHPIETQLNVDAEEIRTEIKKTNGDTMETPEDILAHYLDGASQSGVVTSPSPVHPQGNIHRQTLEYVIGPHGAQLLVHDSYHFYKESTNSNVTYWCCNKRRFGCPARINTSDEKIVKYNKSHNHPIETQCLDGASQSVTLKLPSLDLIQENIQRQSATEQKYLELPLNRQESTLPEEFSCTLSGTGDLAEAAYNDYASTKVAHNDHPGDPLRVQTPRSMKNEFSSLAYGLQRSYGYPPTRDSQNVSYCQPHNSWTSPTWSDDLAETLAPLKEINLTPVTDPVPLEMAAINEHTMINLPEPMLPPPSVFQQQHAYQQPLLAYHMSSANKVAPKPVAHGQPPSLNLAPNLKVKKETTVMPKTVELPKSSAISIFPVANKKSKDSAPQTAFRPETSAYPPSEGDFYASDYGTQQQFAGNYSLAESQFQYDSYNQNYQPDFASQSEYSSQSSFYYPQYQLGAHSGQGFSGLYASENSAQYSNATAGIYPNQSSSQSYDQYGSFYGKGQTNEASQPATKEPPSTSQ